MRRDFRNSSGGGKRGICRFNGCLVLGSTRFLVLGSLSLPYLKQPQKHPQKMV